MSESSPESLPEVLEETVDATALAAAFDRVARTGRLLGVVVKEQLNVMAKPPRGPEALDEAREALTAGRVNGVQLRYLIDQVEWWDTIMAAGPGAWRVVRIVRE